MHGSVPRYLVTFDIGKVTGVAHGPFAAVQPSWERWPLDQPRLAAGNPIGQRAAALDNTLSAAFDRWSPSHVVMAERFPGRNMGEVASNLALDGVVLAECWRRGIAVLVQPEGTVRREILGRGSGPTLVMKTLVIGWCARQGIVVEDHNVGDAIVLWRWARDEMAQQRLRAAA